MLRRSRASRRCVTRGRGGDASSTSSTRSRPSSSELLPLIAIPFDADVPLTLEVSRIAPQFRRARGHEAVADLFAAGGDANRRSCSSRISTGSTTRRATSCASSPPDVGRSPWLIVLSRRPGPRRSTLDADERRRASPLEPLDADAALALAGHRGRRRCRAESARLDDARRARRRQPALRDRARDRRRRSQGSADALADSVESLVTSKIDTLPAARSAAAAREVRCSAASSTSSCSPTRSTATTCATRVAGVRSTTFLVAVDAAPCSGSGTRSTSRWRTRASRTGAGERCTAAPRRPSGSAPPTASSGGRLALDALLPRRAARRLAWLYSVLAGERGPGRSTRTSRPSSSTGARSTARACSTTCRPPELGRRRRGAGRCVRPLDALRGGVARLRLRPQAAQ